MKQPAAQLDALQTSPAPQLVPGASSVQAVAVVPGWQLSQAFVGLAAPDA
jgi:hypothetical protein